MSPDSRSSRRAASSRSSRPLAARAQMPKTEDEKTVYALGLAVARTCRRSTSRPTRSRCCRPASDRGAHGQKPAVDLGDVPRQARTRSRSRASRRAAAKEREASAQFLADAAAADGRAEDRPRGWSTARLKAGLGRRADDQGQGEGATTPESVGTAASSTARSQRGQPADFPLGRMIPCWTEGISLMKPGGKAVLTCPGGSRLRRRGRAAGSGRPDPARRRAPLRDRAARASRRALALEPSPRTSRPRTSSTRARRQLAPRRRRQRARCRRRGSRRAEHEQEVGDRAPVREQRAEREPDAQAAAARRRAGRARGRVTRPECQTDQDRAGGRQRCPAVVEPEQRGLASRNSADRERRRRRRAGSASTRLRGASAVARARERSRGARAPRAAAPRAASSGRYAAGGGSSSPARPRAARPRAATGPAPTAAAGTRAPAGRCSSARACPVARNRRRPCCAPAGTRPPTP